MNTHIANRELRIADCHAANAGRVPRAQSAIHNRQSATGFTLIEIIVVVAILMLLLGIGLAYGPGLLAPAERQQTVITLKNLQMINDEYAALTGSHYQPTQNDPQLRIEEFVNAMLTSGDRNLKNLMASLDENILVNIEEDSSDPPEWRLRDAWGNDIFYRLAGETTQGLSGSQQLPNKTFPYFASPGPDGQWGDVTAATNTPAYDKSIDNLYSFDRPSH